MATVGASRVAYANPLHLLALFSESSRAMYTSRTCVCATTNEEMRGQMFAPRLSCWCMRGALKPRASFIGDLMDACLTEMGGRGGSRERQGGAP